MTLKILLAVSLIIGCAFFFGGLGEIYGNRKLVHNDSGPMGALAGVGLALILLAVVGWRS